MKKTDCKLRQTPSYEVVGAEFPADIPAGHDAVDVLVEFCATGNYQPLALDLARAIVDEFADADVGLADRQCGVRVRLVPVRDGRFEVHVGGRLIFSKKATYRLPEADEIFYHVAVAREALAQLLPCAV